jgi:hypothetical protein
VAILMMMGGGSSVQEGYNIGDKFPLGNEHEGAGIEILDVAFVKVSHANFFISLCLLFWGRLTHFWWFA